MMISKTAAILLFISLLPSVAFNQQGSTTDLERYIGQNEVLLIFAPTPDNARYQAQLNELEENKAGLNERDLKVFHLLSVGGAFVGNHRIAKPQVDQLARKYRVNPASFTIILIGKDGTEKLRQPEPLTTEKLYSIIDDISMRRCDMRDNK